MESLTSLLTGLLLVAGQSNKPTLNKQNATYRTSNKSSTKANYAVITNSRQRTLLTYCAYTTERDRKAWHHRDDVTTAEHVAYVVIEYCLKPYV